MCGLDNLGLSNSQGDLAQRSDDLRASTGHDGTGVTVGVLSDSYDIYSDGSGVDVIVDDALYPSELMFMDGFIAQAVSEFVLQYSGDNKVENEDLPNLLSLLDFQLDLSNWDE